MHCYPGNTGRSQVGLRAKSAAARVAPSRKNAQSSLTFGTSVRGMAAPNSVFRKASFATPGPALLCIEQDAELL